MKPLPVIILAFANNADRHLMMLKREERSIVRTLERYAEKQCLQIVLVPEASVEDLTYYFEKYRDRTCIFHYAGHADGGLLQLTDQAGAASGLAQLVSWGQETPDPLNLVFLNGCATRGQVKGLHRLGVKNVIATSSLIGDSQATEFAEWFYKALANKRTILDAFRFAAGALEFKKHQVVVTTESFRSLVFDEELEETGDIPWALYAESEEDPSLYWKLPDLPPIPPPPKAPINDPNYFFGVLEEMAKFNPAIRRDMVDEEEEAIDPREYPEVIIKYFPWPIGAQLRILVAKKGGMNKAGIIRLRQIINVFEVAMRFMSFILLSQIWAELL